MTEKIKCPHCNNAIKLNDLHFDLLFYRARCPHCKELLYVVHATGEFPTTLQRIHEAKEALIELYGVE